MHTYRETPLLQAEAKYKNLEQSLIELAWPLSRNCIFYLVLANYMINVYVMVLHNDKGGFISVYQPHPVTH